MDIRFEHVSKSFGAQTVIEGVSLSIRSGEFVAITGPSGCGKSTLLNLMAGLETPTSGRVLMAANGGETLDVGALRGAERDAFRLGSIGFVFQFFHLLPTLNVLENVCLPTLEKFPGAARQVEREARDLLVRLGLGEALDKYPRQLSGGMQSRAGFARAILLKPKVLLADEPTGSLDSASGQALLQELVEFHRSHACTLVLVTHDEHAAQLAGRRIHMLDGRVVGATSEVPPAGGL